MTTLDFFVVKKTKRFVVHKHIAGDLSFAYEVRPLEFWKPEEDALYGFGIPAKSLADVNKVLKLAEKYGYERARKIWEKQIFPPKKHYHFKLLRGKEAKKYARYKYAYGEYAKKLRKRAVKRKRKR